MGSEPDGDAFQRPNFRYGRVEDGRGSLGATWPSPRFPSPLIKPDVPISGIRLSGWLSARGTRRGRSGQALEAQNAEFSMNDIEYESAVAAPLHLVSSYEESAHTFKDVLVDATVCLAPRAVAKVGGPASQ